MCGGTCSLCCCRSSLRGLSPRVRGNRALKGSLGGPLGSIPACAGGPRWPAPRRRLWTVYPRVCGGTEMATLDGQIEQGLSPRVRGNRFQGGQAGDDHRSIPACAGEPRSGRRLCHAGGVYPRVCGGTETVSRLSGPMSGLSPRVRGNLREACRAHCTMRSIPACAGEPTPAPRA